MDSWLSNFAPACVVTAGAAAVALVVWSTVRAAIADRRRFAVLARQTAELGFRRIDRADGELNQRILRLRRDARRHQPVIRAWGLDEADARFCFIDYRDGEGDTCEGLLLIVCPRLDLPRFRLWMKNDQPGVLASVARHCTQYLTARLGGPVSLDALPHFETQYTVTGEDKPGIRRFFTAQRQRELARLKYRQVEADGDMFSYARGLVARQADLPELLDEARMLLRLFARDAPGRVAPEERSSGP